MKAARFHITALVTTAARCGLEPFRRSRTLSVLGDDHPLSRAVLFVQALVRQLVATSAAVLLGAIAVAARRAWGSRLLVAALVVELTLLGMLGLAREIRREHVLRLIARDRPRLPVAEVAREAQRLASPRHAAQLARRLDRALNEGVRWHELPVASRPPQGIRLLSGFAPEVNEIVAELRSGKAAVSGIALLELFLIGGHGSGLYAGDEDKLREQLWQIRHLLSPPIEVKVEHARW
jgi:hypothetical protein